MPSLRALLGLGAVAVGRGTALEISGRPKAEKALCGPGGVPGASSRRFPAVTQGRKLKWEVQVQEHMYMSRTVCTAYSEYVVSQNHSTWGDVQAYSNQTVCRSSCRMFPSLEPGTERLSIVYAIGARPHNSLRARHALAPEDLRC